MLVRPIYDGHVAIIANEHGEHCGFRYRNLYSPRLYLLQYLSNENNREDSSSAQ